MYRLAALIVAILCVALPVSASSHCVTWGPVGPPGSFAVTLDPWFGYGDCWSFSGATYHDSANTKGVLPGFGTISQSHDFRGEYWSIYDLVIDVTVVPGTSSGSERLRIDVVRGNGTLHTIATLSPSSPSGTYRYVVGDYDNQLINLRIRYIPGTSAGNTVFKIDNTSLWVTP